MTRAERLQLLATTVTELHMAVESATRVLLEQIRALQRQEPT